MLINSIIGVFFITTRHLLCITYARILTIFLMTKSAYKDRVNVSGKLFFYPNRPKVPECEIIELGLSSRVIGVDCENRFWRKYKSDNSQDLPNLCKNKRIKRNKVFEGLVTTGKRTMGWF